MPHTPTAPSGTRFFGRIDSFHCECPACGQIIVAHKDQRLQTPLLLKQRHRQTQYNPLTAVLYCPSCTRAFGVGLLLWPIKRGDPTRRIPADHRPTRRQMRQLAQYAYGIWVQEPIRQGDDLNIAIDQECICPRKVGGWAPACPVHGWAEDLRQQEAAQRDKE